MQKTTHHVNLLVASRDAEHPDVEPDGAVVTHLSDLDVGVVVDEDADAVVDELRDIPVHRLLGSIGHRDHPLELVGEDQDVLGHRERMALGAIENRDVSVVARDEAQSLDPIDHAGGTSPSAVGRPAHFEKGFAGEHHARVFLDTLFHWSSHAIPNARV